MIKTQNLVPEIYYKKSRDFQLFGRLYDIVFNYIKTNTDLINEPTSEDLCLLYLNTLGFFPKRTYDNKLLRALCDSYSNIIKNKGSQYGIELAVRTILKGAGLDSSDSTYVVKYENNNIIVYIEDSISSSEICLLEELFDYIIPFGTLCTIYPVNFLGNKDLQGIGVDNAMKVEQIKNGQLSKIRVDTPKAIEYESDPLVEKGTISTHDDLYQGNTTIGKIRTDKDTDNE